MQEALSSRIGQSAATSHDLGLDLTTRIVELRRSVEGVIRGKTEVVDLALVTLFSH